MICAAAVLMPGRWVSRTVLQAEHCQKMCSSFSGALPQYGHVCVCVCARTRAPLTINWSSSSDLARVHAGDRWSLTSSVSSSSAPFLTGLCPLHVDDTPCCRLQPGWEGVIMISLRPGDPPCDLYY